MNYHSTNYSVRGLCAVLLLLSVTAFIGCARPVGSVTGKVTYQSKQLKGGNVTFVSTEGLASQSSPIKEDGTYSIPQLPAGAYKVCVDTASLKPLANRPTMPGAPSSGAPKGAGKLDADAKIPEGYTPSNPAEMGAAKNAKLYTHIPENYADPNKTDLTFTATGSAQEFPIDLK
jgi:hypothetical protein